MTRRDIGLALGLGLAAFVVYVLGACRTIYVGDSGELVAAAAILGIPHPSGYPLYVLLGHLWILLVPLGTVAFRMSLFSAFWAALTVGGLSLVMRRAGGSPAVSAFAALLLAFSPSFWSQANVQRVYSLNAFFVMAVLATTLAWYRQRKKQRDEESEQPADDRWLIAAFFLGGLGATNHTFMGIMTIMAGTFAVLSEPALLTRIKTIAVCGLASLTGLLPYLYLPLRSRQDPRLDWGNPETWENFRKVLGRDDFWNRAWLEGPADFIPVTADYLQGLGQELLWVGMVLAAVGAFAGRRQGALLPVLVMVANLFIMGLHGSRSDIFIWHRYYIPSYISAALLAGWGWRAVSERWALNRPKLAWVGLLLPLALLIVGYRDHDRSRFTFADDFSRTLLSSLPPGAHLSASDDNILFVLIYLHLVENVRPDMNLIMQGVGDADLPALRFDPDNDPLFFTHHPNWNFQGLELVPRGLVFQVARSGAQLEPVIPKWKLDGEDDLSIPRDYLTSNLLGHFHYMLAITHEKRDWPVANREFQRATELAAENDVLFYNLGLIYNRNGLVYRSLDAFRRSAEINPRHIASNRPVRPRDKVEEAEAEVRRIEALENQLKSRVSAAEGTPAWHLEMAALLDEAGEVLRARGHRLMAAELGS